MDIKWDFVLSLPGDVTFLKTMSFVLVFSLAVFLISLLCHFILGVNSSLKQSLTSALGIIMLYAMAVVIFTFSPRDMSTYLNKLPIGSFTVNETGQQIFRLYTLSNLSLPELCYQILRIFILAVMVNMLGNVAPKDLSMLGWVLFRLLMLCCAIALNYAVFKIIDMFAPMLLRSYAPMILLSILAFGFILGLLKFLSALVLTVIYPIIGAFYTFFFENICGKCLSRAIGSTAIVTLMIFVFEKLGYGDLPIHPDALTSYLPFTVCMFLLWLTIGRIL